MSTHIEEIDISYPSRDSKVLAWNDLKQSLLKCHIWINLAYQDIKLRYRRSILGPFWITMSMAITAYTMGFLYGHLFHTDMQTYFPFLVAGMLVWALISVTVTDLTETFGMHENMLKQIKLPYSLYVFRVVTRNYIIFFHNLIVMVPVLAIFHEVAKVNLNTLILIPGLLILYINGITYGLILAMIGARYRDVAQVIKSLVQVVFFVTPIMWRPDSIPASKQIFILANPFYSLIQLIRAPLLGAQPSQAVWLVVAVITVVGIYVCSKMFANYRSRIIYWI